MSQFSVVFRPKNHIGAAEGVMEGVAPNDRDAVGDGVGVREPVEVPVGVTVDVTVLVGDGLAPGDSVFVAVCEKGMQPQMPVQPLTDAVSQPMDAVPT